MKSPLTPSLQSLLLGYGSLLALANGEGTEAVQGRTTEINTVEAIWPDTVKKDD